MTTELCHLTTTVNNLFMSKSMLKTPFGVEKKRHSSSWGDTCLKTIH